MGSRGVFQPVGQKRLTNVAVVRMKKAGQRFEVACYRNKVQDWRAGIEKDLDEVLQSTSVFHNVSKGVAAKDKDLQAAFGTTDHTAICLEILARGELQVSEEERKMQYEHLFKDVASVLVDKCVNPESGRPYTLALIERALRDVHFNVDPKHSAKQQALEVLPLLQKHFPIQRARMRLKLSVPVAQHQEMVDKLKSYDAVIESSDTLPQAATFVVLVDPGLFRHLNTFLQSTMNGKGRMEVVNFAVMAEGITADAFASETIQTSTSSRGAAVVAHPSTSLHPTTQSAVGQQPSPLSPHSDALAAPAGVGAAATGLAPAATGPVGAAAVPTAVPRKSPGPHMEASPVVYRGPISQLPEEHASRRERFAELDELQPGWQVELRSKGDSVEAAFYTPDTGTCVGAYTNARRMALAAKKAAAAQ
uniref:SBDS family rRNA metabolism protein n=1 Tax=Dunaliella tertiolecta TaxID=3047 RepID=A0A7S3VGJ4_DUNTE|mmetsp:Transcript_13060/g.35565  ORF Transcript_13060/g.35565 Transcript_13060/m.35565 type:complete len:420 (+) Transcript_13060:158-1417(+)